MLNSPVFVHSEMARFMPGIFCALFRKLRSQINSKIFLKTQHFGGMIKILSYFSLVFIKKGMKETKFSSKKLKISAPILKPSEAGASYNLPEGAQKTAWLALLNACC